MRPRATFASLMGLAAESMTGGSTLKIPNLAESTWTAGLRLVQAAPSMRKTQSNSIARRRMSSSVDEYTPPPPSTDSTRLKHAPEKPTARRLHLLQDSDETVNDLI